MPSMKEYVPQLQRELDGLESKANGLKKRKATLRQGLVETDKAAASMFAKIQSLEASYARALECKHEMEVTSDQPLLATAQDLAAALNQIVGENKETLSHVKRLQNDLLNDATEKAQKHASALENERAEQSSARTKQEEKLAYLETVLSDAKAVTEQQTTVVEAQVQNFSEAMQETQAELARARDTVKTAKDRNRHYLRVARASETLRPDHERTMLKLPDVFREVQSPRPPKPLIGHTEEFLQSPAGKFGGAKKMLFATEKARDAFEKWATCKKRRTSMSDSTVDVDKTREEALKKRQEKQAANEKAFQEWAADKQRRASQSKKELRELYDKAQLVLPKPSLRRSISDGGAVKTKKQSNPYTVPLALEAPSPKKPSSAKKVRIQAEPPAEWEKKLAPLPPLGGDSSKSDETEKANKDPEVGCAVNGADDSVTAREADAKTPHDGSTTSADDTVPIVTTTPSHENNGSATTGGDDTVSDPDANNGSASKPEEKDSPVESLPYNGTRKAAPSEDQKAFNTFQKLTPEVKPVLPASSSTPDDANTESSQQNDPSEANGDSVTEHTERESEQASTTAVVDSAETGGVDSPTSGAGSGESDTPVVPMTPASGDTPVQASSAATAESHSPSETHTPPGQGDTDASLSAGDSDTTSPQAPQSEP